MLPLIFLLFSDFTYVPKAGHWIDYTRSGQLTQTRHLIMEHTGPVGDYSDGGVAKVFDDSGRFLYEMKEAAGAWFIIGGIADSNDLYVYQKHPDKVDLGKNTFHLWHPQYGDREITVLGKHLALDREPKFIQKAKQGLRIGVMSLSLEKNDTGLKPSYHLEIVDLKGTIQELFSASDVPVAYYADATINAPESTMVDHVAYFHTHPGGKNFLLIDLETDGTQPREVVLTYPGFFHAFSAGMVSYATYYDGSVASVLEGAQEDQPRFVLAEADKERSGYRELFSFLGAFNGNQVYREGTFLYARSKDRFYAYDLTNDRLSVFSADTLAQEWNPVILDRVVTATTSSYKAKTTTSPLEAFRGSRPELVTEIDATAFRKPLN